MVNLLCVAPSRSQWGCLLDLGAVPAGATHVVELCDHDSSGTIRRLRNAARVLLRRPHLRLAGVPFVGGSFPRGHAAAEVSTLAAEVMTQQEEQQARTLIRWMWDHRCRQHTGVP